jgi:hypothetical protein
MKTPVYVARQHKPASSRLRWNTILGIEGLVGVGLLALLCGLSAGFGTTAVAKARMAGIWTDFYERRNELIEQLAVTGEGFAISSAPASAAASGRDNEKPANDEIEDALSFRNALRNRKQDRENLDELLAAPAKDKETLPGFAKGALGGLFSEGPKKVSASEKKVNALLLEQSVVIGLEIGSEKKPYLLTITPAAIGHGIPGSLLWMCGQRQPPPGWYRLPGQAGTDLPQDLLYSVCR